MAFIKKGAPNKILKVTELKKVKQAEQTTKDEYEVKVIREREENA